MSFFAWHGTPTIEHFNSILAEGFLRDSWFARDRTVAETMGGPYLLFVKFPGDEPNPDEGQEEWWQFHTNGLCVPAKWIVGWINNSISDEQVEDII